MGVNEILLGIGGSQRQTRAMATAVEFDVSSWCAMGLGASTAERLSERE